MESLSIEKEKVSLHEITEDIVVPDAALQIGHEGVLLNVHIRINDTSRQ